MKKALILLLAAALPAQTHRPASTSHRYGPSFHQTVPVVVIPLRAVPSVPCTPNFPALRPVPVVLVPVRFL